MEEGAADVDVFVPGAVQTEHDAAVHHHGADGHEKHGVLIHRGGMQQAHPAFVEDPEREADEREGVQKRGENAGAVISEGARFVGWFALQVDGEPGEQQRQSVGGVMPGVGDQRKTVGPDAGRQFEDNKRAGGEQRPDQDFSRCGRMVMGMQTASFLNSSSLPCSAEIR